MGHAVITGADGRAGRSAVRLLAASRPAYPFQGRFGASIWCPLVLERS